jgi:hypothetical protein
LAPAETPTAKSEESGELAIDRNYARAHLSEWLNAPRRDPFLLESAFPANLHGPSPLLSWKLKAIWRQTGGRVAAINDRVYAEGDSIQGYRIVRIEGDEVWLDGPRGKERLGFQKTERSPQPYPQGTNPTPQPSTTAARN